jgi:hypothetical protein
MGELHPQMFPVSGRPPRHDPIRHRVQVPALSNAPCPARHASFGPNRFDAPRDECAGTGPLLPRSARGNGESV